MWNQNTYHRQAVPATIIHASDSTTMPTTFYAACSGFMLEMLSIVAQLSHKSTTV